MKGKAGTALRDQKEYKQRFLDNFEEFLCNVGATCRHINISRQTFYNWVKTDTEFAEAVKDMEQVEFDIVHHAWMKNIKSGDQVAINTYLKYKGHAHGLFERHDVTTKGESLNTTIQMPSIIISTLSGSSKMLRELEGYQE